MRRATIGGLLLLVLTLSAAPATASAGARKLVEGTVYDTTCITICQPECPPPPHCGPTPQQRKGNVICARASIVCPLYRIAPGGSIYTGEGSLVNVRKRGSATVIARLPIVEGHFRIRLEPGEYVFRPYMAEEQCWSAATVRAKVEARSSSPVPVTMDATDGCVVHAYRR